MSRMPSSAMCSVRGIGRGGEGEDVDGGAEGLEPLLVLDAEALLLVDDDQAEILELHVLLHQAMGADEDVDGAGGGVLEDLADLASRAEAVDDLDPEGELGHPLAEGAVVLLGQDGGGHEDGDLLAGVDRP